MRSFILFGERHAREHLTLLTIGDFQSVRISVAVFITVLIGFSTRQKLITENKVGRSKNGKGLQAPFPFIACDTCDKD